MRPYGIRGVVTRVLTAAAAAGGATVLGLILVPATGALASQPGTSSSCHVQLNVTKTEASVTIESGCTGSGYWLISYTTQSDVWQTSHPQHFYASSGDAPPWTVALPPCYWQIDFVQRDTPPPASDPERVFIAGELGGNGVCSKPVTTNPPPAKHSTAPTATPTKPADSPVPTATPVAPTNSPVITYPTYSLPSTQSAVRTPAAKAPRGDHPTSDDSRARLLSSPRPLESAPASATSTIGAHLAFTWATLVGLLLCALAIAALCAGSVITGRERRARSTAGN